MHTHLAALA